MNMIPLAPPLCRRPWLDPIDPTTASIPLALQFNNHSSQEPLGPSIAMTLDQPLLLPNSHQQYTLDADVRCLEHLAKVQ